MIKDIMNKSKISLICLTTCLMVLLVSTTCFAATDNATANADLVSACNQAVAQITANINAVLPIALPLLGLVIAITAGIRVFRRITSTAVSG